MGLSTAIGTTLANLGLLLPGRTQLSSLCKLTAAMAAAVAFDVASSSDCTCLVCSSAFQSQTIGCFRREEGFESKPVKAFDRFSKLCTEPNPIKCLNQSE